MTFLRACSIAVKERKGILLTISAPRASETASARGGGEQYEGETRRRYEEAEVAAFPLDEREPSQTRRAASQKARADDEADIRQTLQRAQVQGERGGGPEGDHVRQDRLLTGCGEGFAERDLLRGYLFEDGTGSFDGLRSARRGFGGGGAVRRRARYLRGPACR